MYTNRSNNRKIAIAIAVATVALVAIVLLLLFLVNGNGNSIDSLDARVEKIEAIVDGNDSLSESEKAEVMLLIEAAQLSSEETEDVASILDDIIARLEALESRNSTSSFDATSIWAAIEELRVASQKAYDDTAVWQAINELREELSVSQYDDSAVMALIADLQAQIADLQAQINYTAPTTPTSNPVPSEPTNPGQGSGTPSIPEEPTGYQGHPQPSDPVVEVEEPEGYQGGNTSGKVIDLRTGSNSTTVEEPADVVDGTVSDPDGILIGEPDNVYQGN